MIVLATLFALATAPATIDALRWRERLLVVFAPDAADPALVAQRRAAPMRVTAVRDLRLVEVAGDHVTGVGDGAGTLRRRYHVTRPGFRALLIGKDGGVKIDSTTPISTERLIETIDAMPMARAEARRRR